MTWKAGAYVFTSDIVRITAPTAIAGMLMIVTTVLATTVGGGASTVAFPNACGQPSARPRLPYLFRIARAVSRYRSRNPTPTSRTPIRYDAVAPGPHTPSERAGSGKRKVHAAAKPPMKIAPRTHTTPARKNARFAIRIARLSAT